MRFILPRFRPEDSFIDNVAFTLERMGHEVLTRERASSEWPTSKLPALLREVSTRVGFQNPEERWLLKAARDFRPDVVLALTKAISEETLFAIRKLGVPHTVAWWGDAPANMRSMGLFCDGWDHIFMKDPEGVKKLRRVGLNAHPLHEAMNPEWHRCVATRSNREVAVAGNFYGFRQLLVSRLIDAGVSVGLYGPPPPRWAMPVIRECHSGRFLVKEEKSRVFGEALACLNSMAMAEGNALNCRAFEIAGAGGLQLLEQRPIVEECFEPGRELLTFDTLDELLDLIQRAEREPQWADAVRQAGNRRALAEHTYEHRLRFILETIESA